jgi:zinc and cadmium transporter
MDPRREEHAADPPRDTRRLAVTTFAWIFLSGLLMSGIALVGSVTLLLRPATLDRVVSPLVAFAAGSLLGGAFFHMLPAAASPT